MDGAKLFFFLNIFANFVNSDIHTQNIEDMWMRVKRKLRLQFGTSRALICCTTWYNYIIFCPTDHADYVTILFHVFYQYTTFKIALIIYAAPLYDYLFKKEKNLEIYRSQPWCEISIGVFAEVRVNATCFPIFPAK